MRLLVCLLVLGMSLNEIGCPPVAPNPKPVEGESPDEDDLGLGLQYDRYLREVVMALEEDDAFRKKLEEMNMTDIKNGKIAAHLDLVSHQIRERLDEIKRTEINRLRMLAKERMKQMNGMQVLGSVAHYGGMTFGDSIQKMDENFLHHVDVKNPHSFEMGDLEKLIKKATNDLDEIDKKRRGEFKTYEMEKEHLRREELKGLDEEHRKTKEEEQESMKKRHQQHAPVHHPGSKKQLEDVWEKTDHMDSQDFDPKTFFKMHDLDGNGLLDQDEVEALFQKELDQVYDPNMPEDDMHEKFEDMARMREHVFQELDKDGDRLITMEEFLNYTASQEFEKDEGWKTVDEQQNYTDEEYAKYEEMLRQHEEEMRRQGLDPNMVQPGMVPLGQDPNVAKMQMPHGGQQGMQQDHMQQQQMGGAPMGHQQQMGGAPMGHQQQMGGVPMGHQQQMGGAPMGHQQQMGGAPMGHQQQMGGAPIGHQKQMGGAPMDHQQQMGGGPPMGSHQQMGGAPMGHQQQMGGAPMDHQQQMGGGPPMGSHHQMGGPPGGPMGGEHMPIGQAQNLPDGNTVKEIDPASVPAQQGLEQKIGDAQGQPVQQDQPQVPVQQDQPQVPVQQEHVPVQDPGLPVKQEQALGSLPQEHVPVKQEPIQGNAEQAQVPVDNVGMPPRGQMHDQPQGNVPLQQGHQPNAQAAAQQPLKFERQHQPEGNQPLV